MSKRPPDIIDPVAFAEKGRAIAGVFPLTALERLRDQLLTTSGEVRFQLRFAKEGTVVGARGRIEAELSLQCQACLGALAYRVDSATAVGFVSSLDEAALLPEPFEPVLLEDPRALRLADLIEDELLLSLPQVPRHEVCEAVGRGENAAEAVGRRPFAGLARMFSTDTTQE